ncbi:MAG: lysophospholipase [Planctomycetes bacterium]|nr:lysophospholipase [Planctomycetota bacterium]
MEQIYIESDGIRLNGEVHLPAGDAPHPTVILCHGLLSCLREFQDLGDRLARAGFASVAFNFRGCGDSGGTRGYESKPGRVRDVQAVVDYVKSRSEFDTEKIFAIGHSMGGQTLIATNGSAKDIKAFVIVASPFSIKAEVGLFERIGYAIAYYLSRPLDALRGRPTYIPNRIAYHDMVSDPQLARELAAQNVIQRHLPLINYPTLMAFDVLGEAAEAKTPALFILCKKDRLVKESHFLRLYEIYAGEKRMLSFEDSGHSIFADKEKIPATDAAVEYLRSRLAN